MVQSNQSDRKTAECERALPRGQGAVKGGQGPIRYKKSVKHGPSGLRRLRERADLRRGRGADSTVSPGLLLKGHAGNRV